MGKEDNYKYLVALYTYHFRERFTFFFFLASLLLGNLRQEAQVFIHTRLLRVNTICGSQRKISNVSCFLNYSWQRCRCIFILFFHIQIFFLLHFRYEVPQDSTLTTAKVCQLNTCNKVNLFNRRFPVIVTIF